MLGFQRTFGLSDPLLIGIQPFCADPHSDFHFTCFVWFPATGIFRNPTDSWIIAAGTREGFIVIFVKVRIILIIVPFFVVILFQLRTSSMMLD